MYNSLLFYIILFNNNLFFFCFSDVGLDDDIRESQILDDSELHVDNIDPSIIKYLSPPKRRALTENKNIEVMRKLI